MKERVLAILALASKHGEKVAELLMKNAIKGVSLWKRFMQMIKSTFTAVEEMINLEKKEVQVLVIGACNIMEGAARYSQG